MEPMDQRLPEVTSETCEETESSIVETDEADRSIVTRIIPLLLLLSQQNHLDV